MLVNIYCIYMYIQGYTNKSVISQFRLLYCCMFIFGFRSVEPLQAELSLLLQPAADCYVSV